MTYHIMAVCTGNVCRSPAIQGLLASAFRDDDVLVESAGTGALVGHGVAAPMAELLRPLGALPSRFAARQLTEAMIRDADLVLTATRAHRSTVVQLVPAAVRRTFTVRELGLLAAVAVVPGSSVVERLRALPAAAAAARAGAALDDVDVVDPWGQSAAVYEESLTQLSTGCDALVRAAR